MSCWVRARSQLGTRFSVVFPHTSCLARNELEPRMTKNMTSGTRRSASLWTHVRQLADGRVLFLLRFLSHLFYRGVGSSFGASIAGSRAPNSTQTDRIAERIFQVSISSSFYKKLLRVQIPNAQKYSHVISVFLQFWDQPM